jgi:hypothetical protein
MMFDRVLRGMYLLAVVGGGRVRSGSRSATVDRNHRTMDKAGLVVYEEEDRGGDLLEAGRASAGASGVSWD